MRLCYEVAKAGIRGNHRMYNVRQSLLGSNKPTGKISGEVESRTIRNETTSKHAFMDDSSPPKAHVAKFYCLLRLIRSVLRASTFSVFKID